MNIAAAAQAKISRKPPKPAAMPLAVRASNTPIKRPLVTVPTTRPRFSGAAMVAASGISICAATDSRLSEKIATANTGRFGAAAHAIAASAAIRSMTPTSRRRSNRSPRGTTRTRPITYPTCAKVTRRPEATVEVCRVSATRRRSGSI